MATVIEVLEYIFTEYLVVEQGQPGRAELLKPALDYATKQLTAIDETFLHLLLNTEYSVATQRGRPASDSLLVFTQRDVIKDAPHFLNVYLQFFADKKTSFLQTLLKGDVAPACLTEALTAYFTQLDYDRKAPLLIDQYMANKEKLLILLTQYMKPEGSAPFAQLIRNVAERHQRHALALYELATKMLREEPYRHLIPGFEQAIREAMTASTYLNTIYAMDKAIEACEGSLIGTGRYRKKQSLSITRELYKENPTDRYVFNFQTTAGEKRSIFSLYSTTSSLFAFQSMMAPPSQPACSSNT